MPFHGLPFRLRFKLVDSGFICWNNPGYEVLTFVVCFLLGNSTASEFYMPTFRNALFRLHRQVGVKNELGLRNVRILYGERFGSKIA